ncbi:NF038122 family metalloprotease [Rhodoblastus sp.]|uniref:NF038122 family metalloprotease n=1 Tax=Rhodoblastus sp. TaxID=1962975 RepID=UPI0035B3597E
MGFIIDIANNISALPSGYQAAINTAINFFETNITNNLTLHLTFDWGALSAGEVGQNSTYYFGYNYSQVYDALQRVAAAPGASAVQQASANLLKTNYPTDPTNGGQFLISSADARALGLMSNELPSDSTITLNMNDAFTWSQSGDIAAQTYDAVAVIEHEISEAMGRAAFLGALKPDLLNTAGGKLPSYNILDMFHYAAAGNASNAAYGAATGALEEPFVAGYNANVQTYFSYNGATVTLPFGSPSAVAAGYDAGDWNSTVVGDAFGYANAGVMGVVSPTDLQTLNILGYSEPACFCAGTRIAVPHGEIAVENLQRGDLALTHDGRAVPVCWVGVRKVARRFIDPLRAMPIRVRAGALADHAPRRDLLLSPDHALFVAGVLVHASALVNGTSIVRETMTPEVFVYYHVETEDHALILAENTPAETFVDNVERMKFDNWAEHQALYPDGRPVPEMSYPRAKARRQVPAAIRAALDRRARLIGAAKTEVA